MLSVFKREMRAMFCTWRGYGFIAMFCVNYCLMRLVYNFLSLYGNVYGAMHYESIFWVLPASLIVSIPHLTFLMLDHERRKGTFSFLNSLPLKKRDIFFGKYLAAGTLILSVYAVLLAVDALLGFYGGADILTLIFIIWGFILIANLLLAVNMLCCVVFKNRIAALAIGYGVGVGFNAFTMCLYLVPKTVSEIVSPLSLFGAYIPLSLGLLDIAAFVLWLTVGGVLVFIAYMLFKRGWKPMLAVVIAAVVVLNAALCLIPDRFRRIDLTSSDSYTLSEDTLKYFGELDDKITLNVIEADGSDPKYEYFLRRVDESSKNIDVKWLSAEDARSITDPLGVTEYIAPYLIVAESEKRSTALFYSEVISYYTENTDLIEYVFFGSEVSLGYYENIKSTLKASYDKAVAENNSETAESDAYFLSLLAMETKMYFNGEPYICGVVEYLTVDVVPKRYVLTGHGEASFSETEMGYYILEEMGLEHTPLDTAASPAIPADAVSILVINPQNDISEAEAELFLNYLNGGGQMTFFTAEENLSMSNLMSVIRAYGLSAESGAVGEIAKIEIKGETEGEENSEPEYETVHRNLVDVHVNTAHKATAELKEMINNVTPKINNGNAISFNNELSGYTLTPILTTSESSYIGDAKDELAPRTVAAVSDREGGGTLLWFTGATSFTEPILDEDVSEAVRTRVYSNIAVVISSFGLAPFTYESRYDEGAEGVVPEAKPYDTRLLSVNETNFLWQPLIIVIAIVIIAVVGIIFCYKRKKA